MTDKREHVTTYSKEDSESKSLIKRAINLYRTQGPIRLIRGIKDFIKWRIRKYVSAPFFLWYYRNFKLDKFIFNGRQYDYFYHRYNETWTNERAVEVPIIHDIINNTDKKILEIGNVLPHYFECSHEVIDKYEEGDMITNQDIVNYQPDERYDLIISISTLEHVGWDEKSAEPEKILAAFNNIRSLIADGGKAVITLPIGYNDFLDKQLKSDNIFDEKYYLKRKTKDNRWEQVESIAIETAQFDKPYRGANELLIGIIYS